MSGESGEPEVGVLSTANDKSSKALVKVVGVEEVCNEEGALRVEEVGEDFL